MMLHRYGGTVSGRALATPILPHFLFHVRKYLISLTFSILVAYCLCSTPQVFVSLALVYTCRQFERQMGTRKFASFLFSSYAITTLVQVAYLTILASLGSYPRLATGPFFYVFSLLPLFHSTFRCLVTFLIVLRAYTQTTSRTHLSLRSPTVRKDVGVSPGGAIGAE